MIVLGCVTEDDLVGGKSSRGRLDHQDSATAAVDLRGLLGLDDGPSLAAKNAAKQVND